AAVARAELPDGRRRLAADVFLAEDGAVAGRLDTHPLGERVDDAHADAVQPAGHLVAATAELAAGVEDGVDDLERILARRVLPDRHAAAVVDDLDHAVGVEGDRDRGRMTGHRLVDRVVDDLPDEVVQTAIVGRPDVHPGTPPNGFQTLEDLDA